MYRYPPPENGFANSVVVRSAPSLELIDDATVNIDCPP